MGIIAWIILGLFAGTIARAVIPGRTEPGGCIGTTAVGGMLIGTVIGVLLIPGLYYLFGVLADKGSLIQDETSEPLSELIEHGSEGENPGPGWHH